MIFSSSSSMAWVGAGNVRIITTGLSDYVDFLVVKEADWEDRRRMRWSHLSSGYRGNTSEGPESVRASVVGSKCEIARLLRMKRESRSKHKRQWERNVRVNM